MSDEGHQAEDFEDLYENAPCGYVSIGADGRIFKVNRTLCIWLGKQPDEIVGKRLRDLLNVAGSIFYETHFAPLLRMQGFFNEVALDLVNGDGATIATIANASERRDAAGNVLFIRVTIFRATERRRYERELVDAREREREARKKLQEVNESLAADVAAQLAERLAEREIAVLREQFIAVLGHDLRNPLAAIEAGRHMLEKDHHDARTKLILGMMGDSAKRMNDLIADLMDLARGRLGGGIVIDIERGRPIGPTLVQVVDEIRAGYPERRIDTRFGISDAIAVDHTRLAQMLSNLLANAVAHGAPEKAISVEARIVDGDFELAVCNGGEPIPPEALERLFQPFYRGEVSPSAQGLGLGLYIASEIARGHGGSLDVSSTPTETRFTFRMPLL